MQLHWLEERCAFLNQCLIWFTWNAILSFSPDIALFVFQMLRKYWVKLCSITVHVTLWLQYSYSRITTVQRKTKFGPLITIFKPFKFIPVALLKSVGHSRECGLQTAPLSLKQPSEIGKYHLCFTPGETQTQRFWLALKGKEGVCLELQIIFSSYAVFLVHRPKMLYKALYY